MGCKCGKIRLTKYNPATQSGDLPSINTALITDSALKYEKSLPLYRTHVCRMREYIFESGENPGGPNQYEYIKIEALKSKIKSEAWKKKLSPGEPAHNLLLQLPKPLDPKTGEEVEFPEDDCVAYSSLICLAVLWCAGDAYDKADVLSNAINAPD